MEIEPIQTGRILYRVEILPENDAKPDNNRREFLIEVTNAKNRVLYLEGAPRWEFKFLKRALLAEQNYQLSAFVQGGTIHVHRGTKGKHEACHRTGNPFILYALHGKGECRHGRAGGECRQKRRNHGPVVFQRGSARHEYQNERKGDKKVYSEPKHHHTCELQERYHG